MLITADTVAQRRYARATNARSKTGLAIGPAVLRGLRDLGYPDAASAIAALIDNAIDAGAARIDIAIETDAGVPSALAVIDNGYGMVPEMLRAANAVGVSVPLGEGPHFARNGFGLPAAPFAIGSRYALLSCPPGCALHGVDMDLAAIRDDLVPEAVRASLPAFVSSYIADHRRAWSSGTIVLVDRLDRLASSSAARLRHLLAHKLGFLFERLLTKTELWIDGVRVSAPDGADGPATIADNVRLIGIGEAQVRFTASLLEVGAGQPARELAAARPVVIADADLRRAPGLVVSRLDRRLTKLATSPLFVFGANEGRIRAELNFPPALDDLFAPTLSLQQVHVAEPVWRALRAAGIGRQLESLRRAARADPNRGQAPDAPAPRHAQASPRRRNRCLNGRN